MFYTGSALQQDSNLKQEIIQWTTEMISLVITIVVVINLI